jgi:hypothetical protein
MKKIEINDLNEETTLTEDEITHVKGGIGLLLPAVQKARDDSPSATLGFKVEIEGIVR